MTENPLWTGSENKTQLKGRRTGHGTLILGIGVAAVVIGIVWFMVAPITSFNAATSPTAQETSATRAYESGYPDADKAKFVSSCIKRAGGERYRHTCQCMIALLEETYPLEQFIAFEKNYSLTREIPTEVQNAATSCRQ